MNFFAIIIFAGAICLARGELTGEEKDIAHEALYISNDDASGGDMILTPVQKAGLRNRVAVNNLALRWKGGVIPYVIDASLVNITKMIKEGQNQITNKTNGCIKFVPRTTERNYVRMYRGMGCSSYVGMVGMGQSLSLGRGCDYIGTVVHELLHAVGFHHEQNRPDRDQYLNIFRENIMMGQEHNFNAVTDGRVWSNFDFDSVMLYGEYAFSRNRKPTMQDKTGKHKLLEPYDKKGMTADDSLEVKKFYDCK